MRPLAPLLHLFLLLASAPSGLCLRGNSLLSGHLDLPNSFTHSRHAKPFQGSHRRLATGDVLNANVPAECADALCLVQALLNRRSQIFITRNIDLRGVGILPSIENRVSISGVCDRDKCQLDAGGEAGIFVVGLGGYLTLKDLDITGGFCNRGPAVLVSGLGADSSPSAGKLEALNVKFFNNVATDVGGAVAIESGGSAFVKNSVFYNNKASKGGAVYVGGSTKLPAALELPPPNTNPSQTSTSVQHPADCSFRSCTTFANTEFSRNQADVAGGAVYVDDSTPDCAAAGGAQLDCTACTFVNNTAGQDGGAIQLAFLSSGATADTQESAFLSNAAGEDGGDVNVQAGQTGAPGAQLHSHSTVFSASTAPKGLSVAVGREALASFSKCDFSSYMVANATVCEGTCNTTCPVDKRLQELQGSCPDVLPPAPLCPWIPQECPPPVESAHPLPTPSPPSPSIPPPQVVLSPPALPPPVPQSTPPLPISNQSPPPAPVSNTPPLSPPQISSPPPLPPSSPSPSPPEPLLPPPLPPSNPSPPLPQLSSPPPPEPLLPPPLPPSNPSPPPPQLSPPPPPALLPPPSPSSNSPPLLPTTPSPPPPPRRRRPSRRPPPSPLYTNSTSPPPFLPPPPPYKKRWASPPPPQGQGTVENAPPAPPPPSTISSPPPPPPSKKRWAFPPPPQGEGTVENAPPAPPPPPSSSITGDPHFVGKHGERFDFHGKDGKDYCVVSDRDIHINMHVFHGKLRKSTFISKLGVLYRGQKILVETQIGSLQSHLWKLAVDDVELRDVNSTFTRAGLTITRSINYVRIVAPGEIDVLADIVRATFGKRGSLKDYINLQVKELRVSPEVHGLLGQTYKETANVYEKLHAAKGKKRSRAAEVFVEGSEADYLTSDVLSTDCKYSTFEAQAAWPQRVKRTLFESMQTLLSLGSTDRLVVRDCVGFGDLSICHA